VFTSEEFTSRRRRLFEKLGGNASFLVQSAPPVVAFEVFRQSNEFCYLTGLQTPQSLLLVSENRSTLFLPPSSAFPRGEEAPLCLEDAQTVMRLTGVDAVFTSQQLSKYLPSSGALYTPHSPAEGRLACQDTLKFAAKQIALDYWEAVETREQRLVGKVRSLKPVLEIRDLSPLIDELRMIKSPAEVAVMRQTGKLSALAVAEAIRSTRPGVYEYQLAAIADYVYRVNGASGEGYRPIVAGGTNIWHSHYYQNNCRLDYGDLVIMDYAPDLNNYTSDIGRMWPVNGKYTETQRELLGFVLDYHKQLISRIRPGILPEQVHQETADVMRDVIKWTSFSKPAYKDAAVAMISFNGHLSHPVGMAVHDVGTYFGRPLEPGMVFSVDPQLWVKDEQVYIRVEDTVAVTNTGVEVLTGDVPIDLDDIEVLMTEPGILQQYPPVMEVKDVIAR